LGGTTLFVCLIKGHIDANGRLSDPFMDEKVLKSEGYQFHINENEKTGRKAAKEFLTLK
jgi:hypothetical protein